MPQEFEKLLVIHKGLQPVTVKGHVDAVKRICRRVNGDLTKESADNYIFQLYQSNYSYTHKMNQAVALEYWFEHLGQNVRYARQRKPKPLIKKTLSEAEITRLLFCCKNIREKAIVTVLAYSGIRPKELRNLKVQDVDFGTNELRVNQGKGMKDGIVYISPACTRILMDYLNHYPRTPENLMFNTADNLRPFGQGALRKLVKVLTRRAKLERRVYPYLFRHSLGTNMVLRGGDIFLVKKQLRHADIMTSLGYIHCLGYGVKNEYERFVPSYV